MAEWAGIELGDDFDSNILQSEPIKRLGESPAKLLKTFSEQASYIGNLQQSSIRPPKPDSDDYKDPVAWAGLTRKLYGMAPDEIQAAVAVPEKAEGYGLEVPEGLEAIKEKADTFLESLHAAGLTTAQAKSLWEGQLADAKKAIEAAAAATGEKTDFLKAEMGAAFDKSTAQGQAWLETYGGEGAAEAFNAALHALPKEQALLLHKALARGGEALGEDKIAHLDTARREAQTPEHIQRQIAEAEGNQVYRDYIDMKSQTPEQRAQALAINAQILELRSKLHPDEHARIGQTG